MDVKALLVLQVECLEPLIWLVGQSGYAYVDWLSQCEHKDTA